MFFHECHKCNMCKSQETAKWFFNPQEDMTYCTMCYHLAKKSFEVSEKDVFEIINSTLFCDAEYSIDSDVEDEVYEKMTDLSNHFMDNFEDIDGVFFSSINNPPDEEEDMFGLTQISHSNNLSHSYLQSSSNEHLPHPDAFVNMQPIFEGNPSSDNSRVLNVNSEMPIKRNDEITYILEDTSLDTARKRYYETPSIKAKRQRKVSRRKHDPIYCRFCFAVVPTVYDRKRHEAIFHGNIMYICDHCNRRHYSKDDVAKHIFNSDSCSPKSTTQESSCN